MSNFIKFSYGRTRFVILAGNKAIKIAMIPLLIYFIRDMLKFFLPDKRRKFLSRNRTQIYKISISYIFQGIIVNNNEYKYWRDNRDERVVPVLRRYLGGLIIMQTRGEEVLDQGFVNPLGSQFVEAGKSEQFCRIEGKLKLADYGETETYRLLRQTFVAAA